MLYSEDWQDRTKSHPALKMLTGIALLLTISACNHFSSVSEVELADQQRSQILVDSAQNARSYLEQFTSSLRDSLKADSMVDRYYQNGGTWVWVHEDTTFMQNADELANFLDQNAHEMGFSPNAFFTDEIRSHTEHFRKLDFDSTNTNPTQTMAQLELLLSKAYLRYALGQRYGFMNPHDVLNRRDVRKGGGYRIVYDIPLEQSDEEFFNQALQHASDEQPTTWLQSIESPHPVYQQLKQLLANDSTADGRKRIICNMERLRWRHEQHIGNDDRYVFVNIPSQQLWAISPDSAFSMRICCGAWRTKTPLLTSQIRLIQLNPEWNIPGSILRDEVSPHAGDSTYFARNRYFIIQRSTGDTIQAKDVTKAQLRSGGYRVAQHSGPRNSLGRIIFRFNNQFDVYLHDTNNRNAFNNEKRTISHGCVRVQRPFDIVKFLLPEADEWQLDKIRMNIDMKPESDRGKKFKRENSSISSIKMNSTGVNPNVPLLIDYYTLYPNPETGEFETWPDRYEYDILIDKALKPFLP